MFLIFLTGCKTKIVPGIYQGTLIKQGEIDYHKAPVSIDLQYEKKNTYTFSVKDLTSHIVDTGSMSWIKSKNQIHFKLASLSTTPFLLDKIKLPKNSRSQWKCYQKTDLFIITTCLAEYEFVVNVNQVDDKKLKLSLTGSFAPQQTPIPLEIPRKYSLLEAIERVQTESFESKIEYQKLLQAREATRASYLNLIPHINFRSILGIASLNPMGLINFAADFIPFLIPTRWIKAKETENVYKTQETAIDILRADLIYQIATQGYLYSQNQMDYQFFESEYLSLSQVLEHLKKIDQLKTENINEMQFRLFSIVNLIGQEMIRLINANTIGKNNLSQSIGLQNPQGVSEFEVTEDPLLIERATPLKPQDVSQMALIRSLELKQIDFVIRQIQLQKTSFYFNWADPDVPSSLSVSLSVFAYASKTQALIDELKKRREQIQSQILQKSENAVLTYNFCLEQYPTLKSGNKWLSERVKAYQNDVLNAQSDRNVSTTGSNFQWAVQAYLQNQLGIHSLLAKFRIARAQVSRLLLEDYYSRIQKRIGLEVPYGVGVLAPTP